MTSDSMSFQDFIRTDYLSFASKIKASKTSHRIFVLIDHLWRSTRLFLPLRTEINEFRPVSGVQSHLLSPSNRNLSTSTHRVSSCTLLATRVQRPDTIDLYLRTFTSSFMQARGGKEAKKVPKKVRGKRKERNESTISTRNEKSAKENE